MSWRTGVFSVWPCLVTQLSRQLDRVPTFPRADPASASPDVLRAMVREFAQQMMDADVKGPQQRGVREVTPDRVNSPQRVPAPEVDTRAGTIELAIANGPNPAAMWPGNPRRLPESRPAGYGTEYD
jgi:hypothetical protein